MPGNSVTVIPHGSDEENDVLVGGAQFYPALSINSFREIMRVGTTVTTARVKHAIIDAALKTIQDLLSFRDTHAGIGRLEDVPSDNVDDISILVHRYRAAVYNEAKATLTEIYRDFDSTQSGHEEADKLEMTTDDYRRVARENIRAILGKPRATIEVL